MPQVFISHSSKDRAAVEREIIGPLRKHGITTWYSTDSIKSATEWERQIRDGLKNCDWFVVVLSPKAVESEWVQCEVDWALEERKGKVIPLLLEDCDPTDLHLRLRRLQYIDFRKDLEAGQQELLSTWGLDSKTQVAQQYQNAREAIDKEDWAAAIVHLQTVLRFDPTHSEAQTELERAQREDTLRTQYSDGVAFLRQNQWKDALKAFREVWKLDRNYRDIAERIAEADGHVAEEQAARRGGDTPTRGREGPPSRVTAIDQRLSANSATVHTPNLVTETPAVNHQSSSPGTTASSTGYVTKTILRIAATSGLVIALLVLSYFVVQWFRSKRSDNSTSINSAPKAQIEKVTESPHDFAKTGDSFFEQKRYADAEKEYTSLVQQNPGDATAQLKLGKTLVEQNNFEKARDFLANAHEVLPRNAEAQAYYGRILINDKKYSTAEKVMRNAINLAPENADYHYYLGVALSWQENKWELAKKEYAKAVKLDRGHELAKARLREFAAAGR